MRKMSTDGRREKKGAFKLDDAIGHLLRRASQRSSAVLFSQLSEHDITPVQFATLARLLEYGSVSQNQLGRLVDIEPGNFHGVINRLAKRKLLVKQQDVNDRRKIRLRLSHTGLELVERLIPMSEYATQTTLKSFSRHQRIQLYKLLRQILEDSK